MQRVPQRQLARVAPDSAPRQADQESVWRGVVPELRFVIGSFGLAVAVFFAVMGAGALVATVVPGWDSVAISSGSMGPTIARGDVVVIKDYTGQEIGIGSVITFQPDDGRATITHRVSRIDLTTGNLITRGDANDGNDSTPVRRDQIVGVGTFLLPWVGLPSLWFRSQAFLLISLFIIGTGLVLWGCRWAMLRRYDPWPRGPAWW